jgi:5-methylcytosine-specific restriction endonuclease McrA
VRRVSISLKSARVLLNGPEAACRAEFDRAWQELERAMRPKLAVVASRKKRETKKSTKKEETAAIRRAVMTRSGGRCEACNAEESPHYPMHMDHFFGRVRVKQSERNCWALCAPCDRMKTDNDPSAADWLKWFIVHATRHGYHDEAKMARNRLAAIELSRGEART